MSYWDPRSEMRQLRAQVDQAFRAAQQNQQLAGPAREWAPRLDYSATDEAFEVIADIPGVTREDVKVVVERGVLTISGIKRRAEGEGRTLRGERNYGRFSRTIPLPDEADVAQVTARLRKGELEVRIGRRAAETPRRVEVVVE